MIPSMPPMIESVTASTRNCVRMSFVFAPIACRSPISRVRSVTETSMMFMIPIPPTISDTDAIAASRIDITCDELSCAWKISSMFRIVKSLS